MAEKKSEKIEREYIVPLRDKCRPVPRYKKTPKAVKSLKEFIARHMKVRDRDLKKIKIDTNLNEVLWARGIKKPLHKIKVKVIKEKDEIKVYAVDLTPKLKFKQARLEKREEKAKEDIEKQKSMMDKAKESMQGKKEENIEKVEKEIEKTGVDEKTAETEAEIAEKVSKKEEKKMPQKSAIRGTPSGEKKKETKPKKVSKPKEKTSKK